jgi:hypothetical protein
LFHALNALPTETLIATSCLVLLFWKIRNCRLPLSQSNNIERHTNEHTNEGSSLSSINLSFRPMNTSTSTYKEYQQQLVGLDAAVSIEGGMTLTTKPHAFAGAVLSPKHARELTPSLCLAIASALAEQSYRKTAVPYTLWITEAWRVLGWAEPSAALFWEMATMYHTLFLAGRAYASDFQDTTSIPPILSCGSTSSMGSGNTHHTDRPMPFDKKKYSTAASAKELPVWLVGTFLLLHCEEMAYQRNLSGMDDRRFYGGSSIPAEPLLKNAGKVDFTCLLKHPSLSPRYVSGDTASFVDSTPNTI